MSQVIRKYQLGKPIKLDESLLFQRDGYGSYKREDIANALINDSDVDDFIKSENMSEEDALYFKNLLGQAKVGIRNGSFTKMDELGIHNTMGFKNSGLTEHKTFLGLGMPGARSYTKSAETNDNKNNALNALTRYFKKTLDKLDKYDYDLELKDYESKHEPKPYEFKNALANKVMGGNWSDDVWLNLDYNPETKQYSTTNRVAAIKDTILDRVNYAKNNPDFEFDTNIYKDRDDYINKWQAAADSLNNGFDHNDLSAFARIGLGNINNLLVTTPIAASTPLVKGLLGKLDTSWTEYPEYTRTIDDEGKKHIYIKGTNTEVNGIIPGNTFEGIGNRYAFDGEIYTDDNLPEKYQSDINNARLGLLSLYTELTPYNPMSNFIRSYGFNYITNLSSYSPKIGKNILYGAYEDPTDPKSNYGYFMSNPEEQTLLNGYIKYNSTIGEYQFFQTDKDGNVVKVIDLGPYNPNGTRDRNKTHFVNYSDISKENIPALLSEWMNLKKDVSNSDKVKSMIETTLRKWINKEDSPFKRYRNLYSLVNGDNTLNVRVNDDGSLEWKFNENFDDSKKRQIDIEDARKVKESENKGLPLKKLGGIIKALLGTKFSESEDKPEVKKVELTQELRLMNDNAKKGFNGKLNVALNEFRKTSTKEKGVLKTSDKVLLGAALTDLASTVLGFVPGANIASAGLGAVSSVATLGADIASDGPSLGDFGRFITNLGMDALSLLPAGKTLKGGKALTTLEKFVPMMLTAINAANITDPQVRSEYNKTLSKIANMDLPSLNTGDIRNLNAMAGLLLGTRNIARSSQNWTNTSKPGSGKFKVSASVKGERLTLDDVDKAFFENTKGGKQITLLKARFADQYNKIHKLEGDKAIKPDDVSVDSKWFGARPKSEEIPGDATPTWFANTWLGKHTVGYLDSGFRGNKNFPLSDAWIGNKLTGYKRANKLAELQQERSKKFNEEKVNAEVDAKNKKLLEEQDRINKTKFRLIHRAKYRLNLIDTEPKVRQRLLGNIEKALLGYLPEVIKTSSVGELNKRQRNLELTFYGLNDYLSPKVINNYLQTNPLASLLKNIPLQYRRPQMHKTALYPYKRETPILEMDFSKPSKAYLDALEQLKVVHQQMKQSNRKTVRKRSKKLSKKEFGGLLFKLGGMIPKYYSGNAMKRGTMGTWLKTENTVANAQNPETWGNYYDMNAIMKDIPANVTNPNDFVNTLNQLNELGLDFSPTLNKTGYKDWNTIYDKTGLNLYFGKDVDRFDYMGPSTYNRNLLLTNMKDKFTNKAPMKVGNFDIYFDGRQWVKAPPKVIQQRTSVKPTEKMTRAAMEAPIESVFTGVSNDKNGNTDKYNVRPADALDLMKALSGIAVNNKVADISKDGLVMPDKNTYENLVLQHGNYLAKYLHDLLASNQQYFANLARYSDMNALRLSELEGSRVAGDTHLKGIPYDSDMWYKTGQLSQQESDAAKARRVELANAKSASEAALRSAKANIDAGALSSNYLMIAAPYITGIVNRLNQTDALKKQLALETYLYNTRLNTFNQSELLREKYKDHPTDDGYTKAIHKLLLESYEQLLKDRGKLLENPWLFQRDPIYSKKGSKLTYKDKAMLLQAKEFSKQLSLASKLNHKNKDSARKDYLKLLNGVSSLTAALIKKGLLL